MRHCSGQGDCFGHGSVGSESCGTSWNSARADSWSGADRVSCALHAGYHFRQSKVSFENTRKPLLAGRQISISPRLLTLTSAVWRVVSGAAVYGIVFGIEITR